ncbi:hypothetical protein [Microbacterium sp. 1.5R]|uniref:hypothetical protein n=1 Tax=Microbacterium sp. 1.5R TaxID=1916917 RepID=UPI0011A74F8C|nr:hypothetical protein [Microbacterium sp. 1.5R]
MKGSVSSSLTIVACTLAVGAALGVGLAYSLLAANTPDALRSEDELRTIAVTMQEFDDPRSVELTARILPPVSVAVNRAGTVTSWACAQGTVLSSATSSVAVDGVNLISLSTSVPLWRDLAPGDKGRDVRALEEELARLGKPVNVDSTFSRDEMSTLAMVAKTVGVELNGSLTRDLVVWLPSPAVTVQKCDTQVSGSVTPGDILATVDSGVVVSPVSLPEGRLPGARYLDLLREPVALGGAGELPPEVTSDAVRNSDAFREAAGAAPEATSLTLKAKVLLQAPVQVAAIPATTLVTDSTGASCVFVDEDPVMVTVAGSEFGNSFVVFASAEPPASVDAQPGVRSTCG